MHPKHAPVFIYFYTLVRKVYKPPSSFYQVVLRVDVVMKALKTEFAAWKTGETCALGKMEFDSLKMMKKNISQGKYTDIAQIRDHIDFLDTLTKKVKKIAGDAHHQLCPEAEKVLAQIQDVHGLLEPVYHKLTAGMTPSHHERPKRYIGTGYNLGVGSMNQAIIGEK